MGTGYGIGQSLGTGDIMSGLSCLVGKGRGDWWGAEKVCQVFEEF